MSHIKGMPDRDLHHEDGSHRSTPASANGHVLELHEKRITAHLELHKAEQHIIEALEVGNSYECRHCGRSISRDADAGWVDPMATGDDSIWREVCDSHDTFTAEHEPR